MASRNKFSTALWASLLFGTGVMVHGQAPTPRPQIRIAKTVDESATVTLMGNVHPMVKLATGSSVVDDTTPMQHMVLLLKADTTQEAQLAQLIAEQSDPRSTVYHQYLTPEQFGAQYGVAAADIAKIKSWLEMHGFTVDEVPAGNRAIVFSGTAGQTAAAFGTEIRHYAVNGTRHYANVTDPKIPAALAAAVGGVVKLHDFRHTAHSTKTAPMYTSGNSHYLSPADYSTIYNIGPLYSANVNGTGQTIAVLARSNFSLSDVSSFRSYFGLKANDPQIVIINNDPGIVQGDTVETTLDAEWSGAIAPNAAVKVIVAASTNSADGIDLSALYAVNNNVAPIISLSYGSCEASMGSTELAFYNSLWQQAAAQGISVMVSSGDSGAAGCSGGSATSGSGQAVNGLCSSPYATCVGGTEFVEGNNPGQYWLPGNNPLMGSAISYLPEMAWNESGSNGGSGLWAGGGGVSIAYAKPAWQVGPGVPADGKRDVPDVSLTASSHDAYILMLNGGLNAVGGTSASAPSFAALMALVNQKMNARQGLANAVLYLLAVKQAAGGAAVFHDTTNGNNTVPGVKGFSAGPGYDLATGLGSVDANQLVTHWADGSSAAILTLTATPNILPVTVGKSGQLTVTVAASAGLKAAVALTVAGAPPGVTAALTPSSIDAPGSGTATLQISVAANVTPGTYALTVTGVCGGQTAKVTVPLQVVVPTFDFSANTAAVMVAPGNSNQVVVTRTPQNGFNSAISLAVVGLPSGVTAAFAPATMAGSNTASSSTLTVTTTKATKTGSYPLTISATGGGVTKTTVVTLTVSGTPSCVLSVNPTSVMVSVGQTAGFQIACGSPQGVFSGPLTLSVSGLPAGMIPQFASATLTPGSAGALSLRSTSSTALGQSTISVTVTGSGFTQSVAVPVTVTAPSTFTLTPSVGALAILPGGTGQVSVTSAHVGTFNSAVSFSIAGLPAGVTASLSRTTLVAPGDGTVVVGLNVAANAPMGTFPLTIVGTGGSVTQSAQIVLSLGSVRPDFSFGVNVSALTVQAGTPSSPLIVSIGNFSGGFNSTIMLTFNGVPAGMGYGNTAANASNNVIYISFALNASSAMQVGTYPITIAATGGGASHSATVQVTVTKAAQNKTHF